MGISIGGGLGPFRARVGTRGFSAGVGPVSAGGSWRTARPSSGRNAAGYASAAVDDSAIGDAPGPGSSLFATLFLIGLWPYLLGVWLALSLGAVEHSPAVAQVGWAFELASVGGVGWFALIKRKRRLADQLVFETEQAADLLLEKQQLSKELKQARIACSAVRRKYAEMVHAICVELVANIRICPFGCLDESVPAGEMLLWPFHGDVKLFEPRVPWPGGQPEQTCVDTGYVVFTDKAIRFFGGTKSLEWRLDRLLLVTQEVGYVTFAVTNRKTISGIGGDESQTALVLGGVEWSQAAAKGLYPDLAIELFESLREKFEDELVISPVIDAL